MSVKYNKLFKKMIDQNVTSAQLRERGGISANIITRLKKNEYVALSSIEKIC